jgi:glucans biosynthesis protein
MRRTDALCLVLLLCSSCARGSRAAERADTRPAAESAAAGSTAAGSTATESAAAQPAAEAAFAPVPTFFEELSAQARALAEQPAGPPRQLQLPATLQHIDYDGYRNIRFRPEKSLWRGEPGQFEVQFFHPGPAYRDPVVVSVLEGGQARALPFSADLFSYQGFAAPPSGEGLEFTGLRVHTSLNQASYRDELVAFHGASYFRALGKGNVYGASARGLASHLGETQPEEFPVFTRFYLLRPDAQANSLWILALLESRSATGAYAFHVRPGVDTLLDVTARLFVRDARAALGLAPFSSMYLCGEEAPNCFGDFRPEIHDSDGLALWAANGERLFRPLRNPRRTATSSFRLDSPRGFGLLQRDRTFDHYQDLEARYQDRPSLWVEPISGFERGSVRLLEIAARAESGDNIAMAWMPDSTPVLPRPLDLRYRLHVGASSDGSPGGGSVQSTRLTRSEHGLRFLVDFTLPPAPERSAVEAVISCTGARVLEQHTEDNPHAHGLRASFEVAPDAGARDVELRAFLRAGSDALSETWSYAWQAE